MTDKKKNGTFFTSVSRIVKKGWGYELIFHNDDEFCGKILHFNKGGELSMHYHINKRECWYLLKGFMIFRFIDPKTAEIKENMFHQGQTLTINRGTAHQLIALEESDIIETSTPDDPEDSYRVIKGDSQK